MVVYTLEQRWEILRLTENADFGKKIIFSDETHEYIEKPTHPKRVTVWCGFSSRGIIGPYFFENEQLKIVTDNGDRYRAMRRILATFGINRTALRNTQPKLHPMFCVSFLKIALSAAELMSFRYLGAAI